jgi:hypothetical protein
LSFYYPPWNNALEPNQGNVRQWLDNLYSKFQPIEQALMMDYCGPVNKRELALESE